MTVAAVHHPATMLADATRWRTIETIFWLCALLPFWLAPTHLQLASQIAITALFAISLDLILGYAGIVSLGHAAFFGLGAYTAGILSVKLGWGEPISGLLIAVRGGRHRRLHLQLRRLPLPPSGADHDHARHRRDAARDRQHLARTDRRRGRPAGHQDVEVPRRLVARYLRLRRLHLRADRAVRRASWSRGGSRSRRSARAARHSRELAADARDRRAEPGASAQDLYDRRGDGGRRPARCWRRRPRPYRSRC